MDFLFDPNIWIAFFMLAALEIVLGIDNIIFISILVGRLPAENRDLARQTGPGFCQVADGLVVQPELGDDAYRPDIYRAARAVLKCGFDSLVQVCLLWQLTRRAQSRAQPQPQSPCGEKTGNMVWDDCSNWHCGYRFFTGLGDHRVKSGGQHQCYHGRSGGRFPVAVMMPKADWRSRGRTPVDQGEKGTGLFDHGAHAAGGRSV